MDDQALFLGGSVIGIILVVAIATIPTVLSIVLFFKVWFMTNDVAKIKYLLQEQMDLEHPYIDEKGDEILDVKRKGKA